MTTEDREIRCRNLIHRFCSGYDWGVGKARLKVLAVNADCTQALIKVPGHTAWSGIGSTSYYSPCVYHLFPSNDRPSWEYWPASWPSSHHREVMEVTRATPLTKKKLTDLMCEHGCNYTYEGMLELP